MNDVAKGLWIEEGYMRGMCRDVSNCEDSRFRLSAALIEHKSARSVENLQIYCQAAWKILWLNCSPFPPTPLCIDSAAEVSKVVRNLCKKKLSIYLPFSLSLSDKVVNMPQTLLAVAAKRAVGRGSRVKGCTRFAEFF